MSIDSLTLIFRIKKLVDELKLDYEYLSEEVDRWGKSFSYDNPINGESESYSLVREQVKEFEEKYNLALKIGLDKHEQISELLEKGKKYSEKIKSGNFFKYPTNKQLESFRKQKF